MHTLFLKHTHAHAHTHPHTTPEGGVHKQGAQERASDTHSHHVLQRLASHTLPLPVADFITEVFDTVKDVPHVWHHVTAVHHDALPCVHVHVCVCVLVSVIVCVYMCVYVQSMCVCVCVVLLSFVALTGMCQYMYYRSSKQSLLLI